MSVSPGAKMKGGKGQAVGLPSNLDLLTCERNGIISSISARMDSWSSLNYRVQTKNASIYNHLMRFACFHPGQVAKGNPAVPLVAQGGVAHIEHIIERAWEPSHWRLPPQVRYDWTRTWHLHSSVSNHLLRCYLDP